MVLCRVFWLLEASNSAWLVPLREGPSVLPPRPKRYHPGCSSAVRFHSCFAACWLPHSQFHRDMRSRGCCTPYRWKFDWAPLSVGSTLGFIVLAEVVSAALPIVGFLHCYPLGHAERDQTSRGCHPRVIGAFPFAGSLGIGDSLVMSSSASLPRTRVEGSGTSIWFLLKVIVN